VLLPVRPQILHGVQFRGIGRQELQPESATLLAHEVPYHAAAVTGQSVPYDQQLAGNVTEQVGEKLDDLRAADRTGKQTEVEVPPGHARDRRQGLPVKVVLQHRCFPLRGPSTAAVWPFAQPAFVDEDDGSPFGFGLFFNSGQRSCFHRRILASSRSRARPTGRWQLQPSCRRMRQACEAW